MSLQCSSALIGVGFQRCVAPAARGLIGGDHDLGFAAVDAGGQSIRREAGKDDGMDRADARAGQHGIGRFGDHRHVDDDAVAFANTQIAQDIGHLAGVRVQFACR